VLEASAPEALTGLQPPNAIFIGGGATAPGLIATAQAALRPDGRLVINAVTLETESLLLSTHAQQGGTLTRMEIHHARPLGEDERFSSWRPARPITQWTWVKP
jgi:precorrin-6Y C5,15-methyltransferase (decarboxylating)